MARPFDSKADCRREARADAKTCGRTSSAAARGSCAQGSQGVGRAGALRALFDDLDIRSHVRNECHAIFGVPTAQGPNRPVRPGRLFVALSMARLIAGIALP